MGQKAIPEQIEYFCDICAKPLTKKNYKDFTINIEGVYKDYSGETVNGYHDHYELCSSCEGSFKDWLKDMEK